jgi:hypothetical protein
VAGEIHNRHVGGPDAVRKLTDHPPQSVLVEVLAVGDVEVELRQRVANAARVAYRVGESVGVAILGVAYDESDALLRMAGGDRAKQR